MVNTAWRERESQGTGTVYIIHGFLCAGKTTWSRELSRRTGAQRLNADEWCLENCTSEELAAHWDACFAAAVAALCREAEQLLSQYEDVILDFGFWSRASRDHAREVASALKARIVHYYIYAPDEVLKERLAARKSAQARRNLETFAELRRGFEEPAIDENPVVIKSYTDELQKRCRGLP